MIIKFTTIKKFSTRLVVVLLALGLVSCVLNQELTIKEDGTGTSKIKINIPDYMLSQIDTLASSLPAGSIDLLNPEKTKSELSKNKALKNIEVSSKRTGNLDISFDFIKIDRIFSGELLDNNVLLWEQYPDSSQELIVRINKENYQQLLEVSPELQGNPLVEFYGPNNDDISRSDYLDLIEYSLGAKARKDIVTSNINLTIKVPSKVISQEGGKTLGTKTVVFKIPLLDLILLNKELYYSIRFI